MKTTNVYSVQLIQQADQQIRSGSPSNADNARLTKPASPISRVFTAISNCAHSLVSTVSRPLTREVSRETVLSELGSNLSLEKITQMDTGDFKSSVLPDRTSWLHDVYVPSCANQDEPNTSVSVAKPTSQLNTRLSEFLKENISPTSDSDLLNSHESARPSIDISEQDNWSDAVSIHSIDSEDSYTWRFFEAGYTYDPCLGKYIKPDNGFAQRPRAAPYSAEEIKLVTPALDALDSLSWGSGKSMVI